MKAIEYLEEQKFGYDHFTKLTSTGINPDNDNIAQFAEDYHKAKLNLLTIPVVVNRRELTTRATLLDFADYSESDKTSQTTDECVDNYLDSIK